MFTLFDTQNLNKSEIYQQLIPTIRALISADSDLPIAALANTSAVLKEAFGWFWVGFYLVDSEQKELQLSAFQGTVACTRIAKGRGVCGQSWQENQIIIVPNVHEHPNHIACSSLSQSEIVVPIHDVSGKVVGVLDVDATELNQFDETDALYLQQIAEILRETIFQAA